VAPFRDILSKALSLYGSEVLALVVVTALLVVALFVVAALLLSVLFGSQTGDTAGASVAAAGLFTTATFATVLGVSLPLALVGVVTSLLLWDVGSFGATLGRELGTRATTTRTELAHGGGTLLVGVGSALLALGVETVVTDSTVGAASGVVPLVGAVVGVLLLVVASR
jgi:preprotein translocase subunit SecG